MGVRDYLNRKPIIGSTLVERLKSSPVQEDYVHRAPVLSPYEYPMQKAQVPKPEWQQGEVAPRPGKTGMIMDVSGMKPATAAQAQQNNPQPTISDRVSKGESVYDILLSMGRPVDYEAEQKKLRRERSAALIGDLAGVVGDSLGLAFGSRRFYPRQSATTQVNGKIQRLQDIKRADDVNYWNQQLSARYKDYEIEKAQRSQDAKLAYQKYKDDIANGKWGAEMKLKVERLNRDLTKDKIDQGQWDKQFSETVRQHAIVNSQGDKKIAISSKNAETSRELKDAKLKDSNAGKSNSMDSITVKGTDGKLRRIDYQKYMNTSLTSYLYGRMKDIVSGDSSGNRTLEDTMMQFGEGGDQSSKMNAIVKRRISDFPELIPELEQIIRNNSTETSRGSLLPRGETGSLLPK